MTAGVIIIGAGGHARVVADALRVAQKTIIGFTDADPARHGALFDGAPVLGGDEVLKDFSQESTYLANGLGSIGNPLPRRRIHETLTAAGWRFITVTHPQATLSASARVESGVQVMAGAVVQPGVVIGRNSIVNTGALIDHDCVIGPHCHVAPGAVLSGGVALGECCHVGSGAVVVQGVTLGADTLVGAGAVVLRDHPGGCTLIGVPARVRVTS